MYISQMKYIPQNVFLSLSDEMKLRMISNQIYVALDIDETVDYNDIFGWLCENVAEPFHVIDEDKNASNKKTKMWIYFYEESDMVAFKLRWV